MNASTIKNERIKKMLLVLPGLALPFITLLFWALGGGKGAQAKALQNTAGINTNIPDAHFTKESPLDKLSYYIQAQKDSNKVKELIKNDPYYNKQSAESFLSDSTSMPSGGTSHFPSKTFESEQRVNRKLAELNRTLNAPAPPSPEPKNYSVSRVQPSMSTHDIDRLEQMMHAIKQPAEEDKELDQLNSVMDKVLDLQNPDRAKQKLKAQSDKYKQQALPVSGDPQRNIVSLLGDHTPVLSTTGFYSTENFKEEETKTTAIEAVIQTNQTVTSGATVRLRLLTDIYVNGSLIAKGSFVSGIATITGERLTIEIKSVRFNENIFPVALCVYDMDGAEGIYIPGAITRDVAKQSADQSMQSLSFATLDPSVGAQAAGAGIAAAKTLFSRKVKLVKVGLKAGYRVLLKDNNQRNY